MADGNITGSAHHVDGWMVSQTQIKNARMYHTVDGWRASITVVHNVAAQSMEIGRNIVRMTVEIINPVSSASDTS